MILGLKGPIKYGKRGKGGNREAANQNEHSKKPKADLQTCTGQHIDFTYKNSNTNKKNTGKTRNAESTLSPAKDNKRAKEGKQKTRKNSKRTQGKPKQENKQGKQQHCLC